MKKSTRWAWAVAAVAIAGVALVLLFVLSLTGESGSFVERHVAWLYWLNVAVAVLLSIVILLAALRLAVRKRQGKFGSALLIKLAAIFALVGVAPGVLIYTVSVQFVSRSIEVWFDAKVQSALDAGIDLGRGTLDALVAELGSKTRGREPQSDHAARAGAAARAARGGGGGADRPRRPGARHRRRQRHRDRARTP
jgi:nitrogen fixation/metabolism regulation signal transduction histidine kinase